MINSLIKNNLEAENISFTDKPEPTKRRVGRPRKVISASRNEIGNKEKIPINKSNTSLTESLKGNKINSSDSSDHYLRCERLAKRNVNYCETTEKKINELINAIQITSHLIEKDWIKLYENLPFHPPRGTSEIENDIEKCIKLHVRGSREDLALTILQTWRRFHIRANLLSLVDSLQKINRFDIIKKLDFEVTLKQIPSMHRFDDEKLPPMSATTRFLIKHYPNLQKTRSQTIQ